MSNKRAMVAIVVAAIAAIAMVVLAAVALLQPRPEAPGDGGTIVANGTEPAPKEVVGVMSARSAFPFVQRWASQYNNDENALGSIELNYYLERPNALGDLMIIEDVRHAASGSHNIPVSAQAAAIVYNIPSFPDVPSGLKLNATILSSILDGTVTRWNDPAIRDLNQNLNLPAERIVVVHENRNSSTLALLERYLSAEEDNNIIRWPDNSVGVIGPDELAATVRQTPYSIGYVDFSYATQTRMTFAAVANSHGEYILPSADSIWQAVNSSMQVQNITGVINQAAAIPPFLNASMFGNSSYPLTGLYYASLPGDDDMLEDTTKNATLDFVKWMIDRDNGQQTLSEVQYPAIYQDNGPLARYAEAVINSTAARVSKDQ
ncbi:substrate-binding domain-containing protein [Candidatus Nitrososphaera gargensis]|nr:substrate-binding domain-containing protein [Candidatus Nitrososphaera gargensis]